MRTFFCSVRSLKGVVYLAVVGLALTQASIGAEARWISLFDGKDLEGWEQLNGWAKYSVEDGYIVGKSVPNSPNSFLCTKKEYGDFELEFEVKVDAALNSGVQIRSQSLPSYRKGRVHGYQVEIAVNGYSGGIYDEARRAKFLNDPDKPTPEIRELVKDNQWAKFRVICQGDQIQTWVNGVKVTDLHDGMTKSGFIGLQVHSVGKRQDPLQVRWRNLRLRELAS
jgi:3-keto-disaccharide hydrolase